MTETIISMETFESTFELQKKGLHRIVRQPLFGKQHLGFAPGGAMDLFSHTVANNLLKNSFNTPTLEIVIAPVIRFKRDCWFAITGAKYDRITLNSQQQGNGGESISHANVYLARSGDNLSFGRKTQGFRSYLSIKPEEDADDVYFSRHREDFSQVYSWVDPQRNIRVLEGPEYSYLVNKKAFTDTYWTITSELSEMGFRLISRDRLLEISLENMVSQAVADGTIQLTPKGPIVLLKYRQTIGGYPRIYNVISSDVDLLGQYAPNQIIRFKKVDLETACDISLKKKQCLSDAIGD